VKRAIAFLTPLGGASAPDASTLTWFPVVGALIGAAVGSVWWGADRLWPPAVAAALTIAADLALTGMLHVDGLVDSADGLLPHLSKERRLEVMSEPTVGAFGIAVAMVVLVVRFAALASIAPNIVLLAGAWCGSRTVMAVAARAVPYARTDGIASAFIGRDWRAVGLYGLIAAVSLGALSGRAGGELGVALGMAAAAGVVTFAHRRIGGFTGDVLGAAGLIGETVTLVIASAKW